MERIAGLIFVIALLLLSSRDVKMACPLAGCSCGHICTDKFDCVRGAH